MKTTNNIEMNKTMEQQVYQVNVYDNEYPVLCPCVYQKREDALALFASIVEKTKTEDWFKEGEYEIISEKYDEGTFIAKTKCNKRYTILLHTWNVI